MILFINYTLLRITTHFYTIAITLQRYSEKRSFLTGFPNILDLEIESCQRRRLCGLAVRSEDTLTLAGLTAVKTSVQPYIYTSVRDKKVAKKVGNLRYFLYLYI